MEPWKGASVGGARERSIPFTSAGAATTFRALHVTFPCPRRALSAPRRRPSRRARRRARSERLQPAHHAARARADGDRVPAPTATAGAACPERAAPAPPTRARSRTRLSGVVEVAVGKGPAAKAGDKVKVHYTGTLTNGTEFDSSRTRNQPFEFTLGRGMVIKGWDQGVAGMKVGGKRKLTIPPSLGYGARGDGGEDSRRTRRCCSTSSCSKSRSERAAHHPRFRRRARAHPPPGVAPRARDGARFGVRVLRPRPDGAGEPSRSGRALPVGQRGGSRRDHAVLVGGDGARGARGRGARRGLRRSHRRDGRGGSVG